MFRVVGVGCVDVDINDGGISSCFTGVGRVVVVVGVADGIWGMWEIFLRFFAPEVDPVIFCCLEILVQRTDSFEVDASRAGRVL